MQIALAKLVGLDLFHITGLWYKRISMTATQ